MLCGISEGYLFLLILVGYEECGNSASGGDERVEGAGSEATEDCPPYLHAR